MRRYLIREGKITSVEFAAPGSDEALIEKGKRSFGKRRAGRLMPSRHGTAPPTSIPRKWKARTTDDPQSGAAIVKDKPFLAVLLSLGLLLAAAVWQFHSLMWG